MSEPGPQNNYLIEHVDLLIDSYFRLTGRELVDGKLSGTDRARALFHSPAGIVSHNTDADPVFNYGNRTAMTLFEMSWEQFTNMPSRQSAEPVNRAERDRLMARVTEEGFIDDYRGIRISATGRRFWIERATVWNLTDESGTYRGQAALFNDWTFL